MWSRPTIPHSFLHPSEVQCDHNLRSVAKLCCVNHPDAHPDGSCISHSSSSSTLHHLPPQKLPGSDSLLYESCKSLFIHLHAQEFSHYRWCCCNLSLFEIIQGNWNGNLLSKQFHCSPPVLWRVSVSEEKVHSFKCLLAHVYVCVCVCVVDGGNGAWKHTQTVTASSWSELVCLLAVLNLVFSAAVREEREEAVGSDWSHTSFPHSEASFSYLRFTGMPERRT